MAALFCDYVNVAVRQQSEILAAPVLLEADKMTRLTRITGRSLMYVRVSQMGMRDHYRTRAAEFQARARSESNVLTRRQYESLAQQYSKLAERAECRTVPGLFGERRRPKLVNRQK